MRLLNVNKKGTAVTIKLTMRDAYWLLNLGFTSAAARAGNIADNIGRDMWRRTAQDIDSLQNEIHKVISDRRKFLDGEVRL